MSLRSDRKQKETSRNRWSIDRPTASFFPRHKHTHTHTHSYSPPSICSAGQQVALHPHQRVKICVCDFLDEKSAASVFLLKYLSHTRARLHSLLIFFFKVRSSFSLFLPPPSEKVKGEWSPLDGAGIEIGLSRTEEGESCPAHPGQHKSAKQRDLSGSGKDHHLWTVPMTTTHTTTRGKTTDTCKYRTRWRMKTFEFPEISFFFRLFWFTEY